MTSDSNIVYFKPKNVLQAFVVPSVARAFVSSLNDAKMSFGVSLSNLPTDSLDSVR